MSDDPKVVRLAPTKRIAASVARRAAIAHLLLTGHGRSARAIWLIDANTEAGMIGAIVGRAVNLTIACSAARAMANRERGHMRGDVGRAALAELVEEQVRAIVALQLSEWWAQPCGHPITDWDGGGCGWGCGSGGGGAA